MNLKYLFFIFAALFVCYKFGTFTRCIEETKCVANRPVVFLKTHKTASSTINLLLLRKALYQNWKVAMPAEPKFIFDQNQAFHRRLVENLEWHKPGMKYDLFCQHAIWQFEEISAIMQPNPFYFTILRDPVELYLSQWDYFEMQKLYKMTIEQFLENGTHLDHTIVKRHGSNRMLYDLGLVNKSDYTSTEKVSQKIKEIEKHFDLVLIMEHFDKSLILLRDALCWNTLDITYLMLNDRKEKTTVKGDTRLKLKKFLKAGYTLYNHFLKIFQKEVDTYGRERMKKELIHFQKKNNLTDECSKAKLANRSAYLQMGNQVVSKKRFCHLFSLDLRPILRKKLYSKN